MKRIAFVSTMEGFPWGGSEELWSQAVRYLCAQRISVSANVKWWPAPVPQLVALEQAGCTIHRRRRSGYTDRLLTKVAPQRTFKWLDQVSPECVVISQGWHLEGLGWMQACVQRKIPYVVVVQAAGELWWPDDAAAKELKNGFEQATICWFVSQGNLDFVRKQLATPLSKARIVRNPFNVPFDVDERWPHDEEVVRLACVGRLEPLFKGQDILFDVLDSDKWRNRSLQVTLYGSGPNRGTLEELRNMRGLKNVVFGGFVSDIVSLWANHHALILPSRFEGLPLAVVEAMLCARPCIVTDIAGNAELLEDNVTGFVAAAPTAPLLDEAMERAWNRRHEWWQIGLAAAEQIRQLVPRDPAAVFANELSGLLS